MGLNGVLNGARVASTADGVPLDQYGPEAAATIVTLFALAGLSRLVLAGLAAAALIRLRGLVTFVFVLLLLEHLARRVIVAVLPIPRVGDPPADLITNGLLALIVIGMLLSLKPNSTTEPS